MPIDFLWRLFAGLLIMSLAACAGSSPEQHPPGRDNQATAVLAVAIGPTRIPGGDAAGAADITVTNRYFSVAFAVQSDAPWGVARGGIIDLAIVRDGQPGKDFVSLIDFMPNYWSAWPNSHHTTEIESQSEQELVIRTTRDWGEVELATRFTIRADSNRIRINTRMHNLGQRQLAGLTSGYIAWPNGGQLFGMPGLTEGDSTPIPEAPAFAGWSASYDRNWALGLYTPFSELVAYTGRDRYQRHSLKPGQVTEFNAWLQVESSADLSRLVAAEIDHSGMAHGRVHGTLRNAAGEQVADSAVVILRDGKLYAWALAGVQGMAQDEFSFKLPVGEYEVYGVARDHAPGARRTIEVLENGLVKLAMSDLQLPGNVLFSVIDKTSKEPLDASVTITSGVKPVIQYFGKPRFFTALESRGLLEIELAPGEYQFDISAGGGFTSRIASSTIGVSAGRKTEAVIEIETLADPAARGWYSADLHHHSDVLDGFSDPRSVFGSQLAAGVDLAFLSDHDSTVNNPEMARLAVTRNMRFIAGTELSASWGHFNAYPIDPDKRVNSGVGLMPVQGIFEEARRLGSEVIHVNHPFGNYGYFANLEKENAVPGGFDPGFDLIEITTEHQPKTLQRAWAFWNSGKPAYFAAGSDVHDVWRTATEHSSGAARSFVHVRGEPTVDSYITALKAGHAYASQGPLIYPQQMFGTTLRRPRGESLLLKYELFSVDGLRRVTLIRQGEVLQSMHPGGRNKLFATFRVQPEQQDWFSLVVEDMAGNYAYSNPLWVVTDDALEEAEQ